MTILTVELPETLTEQLQTSGISQQQLENLVANFIQNYLHQHQLDHPSVVILSQEEASQLANEQLKTPLPEDIASDIAQLDYLTDDDLWLAAKTQLIPTETEQMQALLDKQQLEGLTDEDQQLAQHLSARFNHTMLIRAKAAALLKERGYDISVLKQGSSLE